ncbi:MAG: ABC transporter ATP-binding protein [Canibacter sp.]
MIEIESLTKHFGRIAALDNFSLRIGGGQIVGLLGENGCGKTTLLRILAGIDQPSTGKVTIAGHAPGPKTKAVVSYLPDTPNLPKRVKVSYLIRYFEDFFDDFSRTTCESLLGTFGIGLDRKLVELSKGQHEKVQAALVMSRAADVYLLDEPISGVDPAAREATLKAIIGVLRPGALVIIATHLIADIEPLLDEAILMRHGRVISAGPVDDLRANSGQSLNDHFKEVYAS